jgi:hypothetical protein
MRTTLRMDDALFTEVRRLAVETGRTVTALVTDSLRETLARTRAGRRRGRVRLPVFKGRGLRPGVDLDDSASLLDLMERDASR